MTHPSKRKGNAFERALVNAAKAVGLPAERAYASDGRSLGEGPEVDLIICGWRIQAKRRKKLPAYLTIPEGCEATAVQEDRGPKLVICYFDRFLELLRREREYLRLRKDDSGESPEENAAVWRARNWQNPLGNQTLAPPSGDPD